MRQTMRVGLALLLLIGLLGALQTALGQEVTAGIVGTVVDPSGSPIKAAAVVARDTDHGVLYTAQTNDAGAFNLTHLPVGTYEVKATAPGFDTAVHAPFTLVLNQTARLTFEMKVGKVSETVEVTGSAPVLQTENAQVNTVIDSRTADNLPLETRNYVQLTLLSPGAISVDPHSMNLGSNTAEESGRPYINGNREQANNFLLTALTITKCQITFWVSHPPLTPSENSISLPKTPPRSLATITAESSMPQLSQAPTVTTGMCLSTSATTFSTPTSGKMG